MLHTRRARLQHFLPLALTLFALTAAGCTVYKSSDRDYFDSNAKSGAPTGQSLKPLRSACRMSGDVSAQALDDLNLGDGNEALAIEARDDGTSLARIARLSDRDSTPSEALAAVCRFEFSSTDADAVARSSRALVVLYLRDLDVD